MSTYPKGRQSREEILDRSRELFNEFGIHLTLARLAELLETTLGRLTHHFSNKELLFVAIAREYEVRLTEMRSKRPPGSVSIDSFIRAASLVMDLQYDYRCAMRYVVFSLNTQPDMRSHILDTYAGNRNVINQSIKALVDSGSLKADILEEKTYPVFIFQFLNLFTNWVINIELYDNLTPYQEMKPIYLKGILGLFIPYLTARGKREMNANGLFEN